LKDKISIITICFNSVNFIENAIKSVIEQNDDNFEHIIIDGGSTDGTIEKLIQYNHLRYISENDRGQSDAMNKGFELAMGEIIVYLNADDFFLPFAFQEVRKAFKNPLVEIVIGNLLITEGRRQRISQSEFIYKKIIHPKYFGFPYNPACYFYKKHVQQHVGLFPINEHDVMDYWFVIRAFKDREIVKLDSILGCFQIHESCKTHSIIDSQNKLKKTIKEFNNSQSLFYNVLYCIDEIKLMTLRIFRLI
jgi:glycosyltransferase involved in cell wall biosynthesis